MAQDSKTPPSAGKPVSNEPSFDERPAVKKEAKHTFHPILTDEEYELAKQNAKTRILQERRKAAMKSVEEQEVERLRQEEGLVAGGGISDEMVTVTVDLPEFALSLNINSRPYWHGHVYTVHRHIANSLNEMMFRMWQHQAEIDGKSKRAFYARQHVQHLYDVKGGGTTIHSDGAVTKGQ